jgi:hypothetical protein
MKSYHSIQRYNEEHLGKSIFSFEKIDGSNFRAEWDRKLSKKSSFTMGFSKFGTRREMIHKNSPFIEAVGIFENKYTEGLDKIFREEKTFRGVDRITVYGEFFGENSFAGRHDWEEDHDVIIFDVFLYKKDYLPPADFLKIFGSFDIPFLEYSGILTPEYIKEVENGDGEGRVYKGTDNGKVFMGKIKTKKWLDKVKSLYGEAAMLEY